MLWVKWIWEYKGLSVSEVKKIKGKNVSKVEGKDIFVIKKKEGRKKRGKEWKKGIKKKMIEMGIIEMLKEVGEGNELYSDYKVGKDIKKIEGKKREKERESSVGEWVKDKIGEKEKGGRNNKDWSKKLKKI